MTFFSGIEYRILKFINTGQGNLKQDKSGCITIPGLRTYCREVIIIKLACYWHKNRIQTNGTKQNFRNQSTYLQPNNLWQMSQKQSLGEGHLSLLLSGHQQGAGLQVEHPGLRLIPILDASVISGSFTCYALTPGNVCASYGS